MLQSLSVSELRQLPPEAFPREIPLEVIESAPPELRRELENISLSLGSEQLSRWREDADEWGREVADAIELSRQSQSGEAARELEQGVAALAADWKATPGASASVFLRRLNELERPLEALREQVADLYHATESLRPLTEAQEPAERPREAREALSARLREIELSLGRYHRVHLDLIRREMRGKREEIESHAFEDERVRERLDALHDRLERTRSPVRRSLRPLATRRERERLEQRIADLAKERAEREQVIAEQDMTRWLDGVVEGSLYLRSTEHEPTVRDARLQLFQLLNQFCQQQEVAAEQVARNPFLQLDPEQAIEYLLVSERFILDYFARKRSDVTRWLGNAARQRLAEIEDVQRDILDQYRRHRRRG